MQLERGMPSDRVTPRKRRMFSSRWYDVQIRYSTHIREQRAKNGCCLRSPYSVSWRCERWVSLLFVRPLASFVVVVVDLVVDVGFPFVGLVWISFFMQRNDSNARIFCTYDHLDGWQEAEVALRNNRSCFSNFTRKGNILAQDYRLIFQNRSQSIISCRVVLRGSKT